MLVVRQSRQAALLAARQLCALATGQAPLAVQVPSGGDSGSGSTRLQSWPPASTFAAAAPRREARHSRRRQDELTTALQSAPSVVVVARTLLAHRAGARCEHLLLALARMGHVQRRSPGPPSHLAREAFGGALEVALDLRAAEGRRLAPRQVCELLDAAAWLRQPPTPEQQAVLEGDLVAGLCGSPTDGSAAGSTAARSADDSADETACSVGQADGSLWGQLRPRAWEQLLTAYLRLGLRPGAELAALLTQPATRAQPGEENVQPSEAPQGQPAVADPGLAHELRGAASLTAVARPLVLHGLDQLDAAGCIAALEALEAMGALTAARRRSGVGTAGLAREVARAVRNRALQALAVSAPDGGSGGRVVATAQLLALSAALGVALPPQRWSEAEQGLAAQLAGHDLGSLAAVLAAYAQRGMQPRPALSAAALQAAERLLPACRDAGVLAGVLGAGSRLCWPASQALVAAAETAALGTLRERAPLPQQEVAQLLQALTGLGRPPAPELASELREAVLRCLPGTDARWASAAASCCRKLALLPHEALQRALCAAAAAALPHADPETALALLARLLLPLQRQGWRMDQVPVEAQAELCAVLDQLTAPLSRLENLQMSRIGIRGMLGSVVHCLQLCAAVHATLADTDLEALCEFIKRQHANLTPKQHEQLLAALEGPLRFGAHSLPPLGTPAGGRTWR